MTLLTHIVIIGVHVIRSFACKQTQALFERLPIQKIPENVQRAAFRKLKMLDAATSLADLTIPLSNRLEKLRGGRAGQYSIRINDQWRICFWFENSNVTNVEIIDYH